MKIWLKIGKNRKTAKNRNETGSDLSLGERLTRLSKRLSRKRCCDTTPDRCQEGSRLTILLRIVKKMLQVDDVTIRLSTIRLTFSFQKVSLIVENLIVTLANINLVFFQTFS